MMVTVASAADKSPVVQHSVGCVGRSPCIPRVKVMTRVLACGCVPIGLRDEDGDHVAKERRFEQW